MLRGLSLSVIAVVLAGCGLVDSAASIATTGLDASATVVTTTVDVTTDVVDTTADVIETTADQATQPLRN